MAETKPSIRDIKLLFARSGNRCAFPKCPAPLALNGTLVGEICHIKGDKPGSPRYDAAQTDEERHAYGNLIILCPTHHAVVDDDPESYTVERLHKMKSDHEAMVTPIPDADASQIAKTYFDQSVLNVGQSGGLSAHTVHAQTINLQSGHMPDPRHQRQMQAVEILWQTCRDLRKEFGDLIMVDTLLLPSEINDFIQGGINDSITNPIRKYKFEQTVFDKLNRAKAQEAENERPFVSGRLWSIMFVLRAVYGRLAYLFQKSFEEGNYKNWREDSGFDQLLRSILPSSVAEQLKKLQVYGLQTAVDVLEDQFLAEAGMRSGAKDAE
jgi:hypothetical protein